MSFSASAAVFQIDWDVEAEAAQATDLAWKIYFSPSGGAEGAMRASIRCYSTLPSFEISSETMFCIAFDAATALWMVDDGQVRYMQPDTYFGANGLLIRPAMYFSDWEPYLIEPFMVRVYNAIGARHDEIVANGGI